MKKLDWYIIRQYLGTYLFVVLVFVTIICVLDFTEKNDDFMEQRIPMSKVLFEYYANLYPYYINFLSPIMIFISTIMVTSRLASHTEIIAILSSGVSFLRMLWSYMIGAVFLAIVTFLMINWVIPNANKVRVAFELEHFEGGSNTIGRNNHLQIEPGVYAYVQRYNNDINIGSNFTLEKIENNVIIEKLRADRIVWDTTRGDNRWLIKNYSIRKFENGMESLSMGEDLDTVLNMYPDDFKLYYKVNETLTYGELEDFITELQFRGMPGVEQYLTEKYERLTYPFAIIILTTIGVIVSARKSREGIGFQIVLGIILALVYILFLLVGRNFTKSDFMHPLINAWLPNIIFSVIGVVLYRTIPK